MRAARASSIVAPVAARIRSGRSAAAGLIAVVALGAAVVELPHSLRSAQRQVAANAGLSLEQRELAPARAYNVNESLALRAGELLPRDAVFYVATGDGPGATAAPPFYAFWLLPRRHTDQAAAAQWIVDAGADASRLGVKASVVADLGGGAEILRVRR
jgi:hypothetical protein